MTIGLLGGTFDPVHLGHLHVANWILQELPITDVRLMPCYQPVHRDQPAASTQDRVNMLELAVQDIPHLTIELHEIDHQGPSFMINTLKEITNADPICLIMGADTIRELDSWKDWQDLLDYCHFIVVNRPGYEGVEGQVADYIEPHLCPNPEILNQTHHGLVHFTDIPPSPISASELRAAVKEGKKLDDFVPKSVLDYIREHDLYKALD